MEDYWIARSFYIEQAVNESNRYTLFSQRELAEWQVRRAAARWWTSERRDEAESMNRSMMAPPRAGIVSLLMKALR